MKYNIIRTVALLLCIMSFTLPVSALSVQEKWENILLKIENYTSKKTLTQQRDIYTKILERLNAIDTNNIVRADRLELIEYLRVSLNLSLTDLWSLWVDQKNQRSLILRFSNNQADNTQYIESYYQDIQDTDHIFLFRYSQNLSSTVLMNISDQLYQINPQLTLYIDQEGGYINRYKSFSDISIQSYLQDSEISSYSWLSQLTQQSIWELFSWEYFPSPYEIGQIYNDIPESEQEVFLRVSSYIILKNLADHGIWNHWLVLDLDRGNPVISGLNRSFSSDSLEYEAYIDAFLWASEITGVALYGKHFPWHGAGEVDSHSWILVYDDEDDYIMENLELFNYFLDARPDIKKGVMVGHMYIPEKFRDNIIIALKKADFILTDDLAMEWYKQTLWKPTQSDRFLTTHLLWELWVSIIIVDTQYRSTIE